MSSTGCDFVIKVQLELIRVKKKLMEEFSVKSILSPMASGSLYGTAPKHCAHYGRNLSLILVLCFLWIEMAVNKEL